MAEELRCPEAVRFEPYDLCKLNNRKVCIRNTGNPDFDTACNYYNDFVEEMKIQGLTKDTHL